MMWELKTVGTPYRVSSGVFSQPVADQRYQLNAHVPLPNYYMHQSLQPEANPRMASGTFHYHVETEPDDK